MRYGMVWGMWRTLSASAPALAAVLAVAVVAGASRALASSPPEPVILADNAVVIGIKKGAMIGPRLFVTINHGIENWLPGREHGFGFELLVKQRAENSIAGSRVIYPEDTRRARLVCRSRLDRYGGGDGYDYTIWEFLEPPPEGVTWLPVTHNLNDIRWVGTGKTAFRARYTGGASRSVYLTPVEFPRVDVFSDRFRPVDGWSGTPVLTDRGELAGLVALGNEIGYVALTIPRWWNCHKK